MLNSIKNKNVAEKKILEVSNDLNIKLMSDDELMSYTSKIDSGHNFGQYSEGNFPYRNYFKEILN